MALTGCVERVLAIDSCPVGAQVFVNGKARGTAPVEVRYVHEGRFEVRLEKEGYESLTSEVQTKTNADAVPGPDLVLETFHPGKTIRRTVRRFELVPLKRESYTPEEMEAVLRNATEFRKAAEKSFTEPGTPTRGHPLPPPAPVPAPSGPPPSGVPPSPVR